MPVTSFAMVVKTLEVDSCHLKNIDVVVMSRLSHVKVIVPRFIIDALVGESKTNEPEYPWNGFTAGPR